jgi:hypothetical protein
MLLYFARPARLGKGHYIHLRIATNKQPISMQLHLSSTMGRRKMAKLKLTYGAPMRIERVTPLLQGVADIRNWIVQHLPLSVSMVGYDLFLKIGNDYFSGKELELQLVFRELPHPEAEVRAHVLAMEDAGLLVEQPASDGHAIRIVPTERFIELLKQYQSKFESQFILRKDLRERQLRVDVPNERLHHLVDTLYDHFYDLGWLYLHDFGGVCFLMSSLVRRVASAYGFKARLQSCHVEIRGASNTFSLGSPGYAAPGQIEGHAVCIIDEAIVVDFGLGNVRRNFRRDFYWGLAGPIAREGAVMAQMQLPQGETVLWKDDWQTPDGPAEFAKYEGLVEQLFERYVDQFG